MLDRPKSSEPQRVNFASNAAFVLALAMQAALAARAVRIPRCIGGNLTLAARDESRFVRSRGSGSFQRGLSCHLAAEKRLQMRRLPSGPTEDASPIAQGMTRLSLMKSTSGFSPTNIEIVSAKGNDLFQAGAENFGP